MRTVLITGIAGFIGFHTALKYKKYGFKVVGCDNFNGYYDPELKKARAKTLSENDISVVDLDIFLQKQSLKLFVSASCPDLVIHLAAMAGVRHSLNNPSDYIGANIVGSQNLIEACEDLTRSPDVIFASTSCVMHGNPLPWNENDKLGEHLSPYGYTKANTEQQFRLSKIKNVVGLRFFTVYGPWGRPDMALFDFTRKILNGESIPIFNFGNMKRDFTYIDDIVKGIFIVSNNMTPRDIYCLGNGNQVDLMEFIHHIEDTLGTKGTYDFQPRHPADAKETWSDITKIRKLGYEPETQIKEGVRNFVEWYVDYYKHEIRYGYQLNE